MGDWNSVLDGADLSLAREEIRNFTQARRQRESTQYSRKDVVQALKKFRREPTKNHAAQLLEVAPTLAFIFEAAKPDGALPAIKRLTRVQASAPPPQRAPMTRVLAGMTQLGIFALFLAPFALIDPFVSSFGPFLKLPAALVSIGVLLCAIIGVYSWGKGNGYLCWRAFYFLPALVFGFAAYCNTGFNWVEDRANALTLPEERVRSLSENPPPRPDPEWEARVYFEYAVAKARDDYDVALGRVRGRITPLPSAATPWLWLLSGLAAIVACLPRKTIDEVLRILRPASDSA